MEVKFNSELIDEQKEKSLQDFKQCYYDIIEVLKEYCDLPEEYYPIISLWVLGTYIHKEFESFPELFINATKGSGKSRLLRLISTLAHNGKLVLDLKEAVLFRTAHNHTLCIDEFERVGTKESGTLRTLINAAYKKGGAVERMKKVSFKGQEEQVVERFEMFTPIAMANIWGMEDVLSDRCITLILEKSSDKLKTMLIENYALNELITKIKSRLGVVSVVSMWCICDKNYINQWNMYVKDRYTTLTTLHTLTTPYYTNTDEDTRKVNYTPPSFPMELLETFNKIAATEIDGRNLELFFPLFLIAKIIDESVFEKIILIAKSMVHEKKNEEFAESKDVSLIDFISHKIEWRGNFKYIHEICQEFRMVTIEEPEEEKWLNPRWIGRALKRSKLISQKRRLKKGIEVMLDIDKAKQLLLRYKEHETT
jgi:hypothetical protein